MSVVTTQAKGYPLPLRVRPDVVEAIQRRFPVEAAVLRLMIADGRAVLVDSPAGDDCH